MVLVLEHCEPMSSADTGAGVEQMSLAHNNKTQVCSTFACPDMWSLARRTLLGEVTVCHMPVSAAYRSCSLHSAQYFAHFCTANDTIRTAHSAITGPVLHSDTAGKSGQFSAISHRISFGQLNFKMLAVCPSPRRCCRRVEM